MARMALTQKKSFRAVQRLRPDIVEERGRFAAWQPTVDGARVVCVDESGIVAGGRVAYGYAPRGQRCATTDGGGAHAPYRRGRRTSLLGWVGLGRGGVVAVEGSVNCDLFERFVRDHLAPKLQEGDIVVWGNHSVHKRPKLRALIEARGAALVWQPRYSPEFNAVEPPRRGGWDVVKGEAPRQAGAGGHGDGADRGAGGGGLVGLATPRRLPAQSRCVAL